MKIVLVILAALAALSSIIMASAQPEHYIVVGHVYPPYVSSNVTLTDQVSRESMNATIRSCEHGLKEYLFDLANLKQGWSDENKLTISYGNETIELTVDNSMAGIQADLNKPTDYTPIAIISGVVLILAASRLYYYIKRKEVRIMVETIEKEKEDVTVAERVAVIAIFGALAIYSLYKGNFEAASGFASTIAVYFLSRQGA